MNVVRLPRPVPYSPFVGEDWEASLSAPKPDVSKVLRVARVGVGIFAGVFTIWAALAPLSSAAIAPGILRADGGGRRTVQHLEGGIIQSIDVREGDTVKAGQRLLVIDGTQTGARDAALQADYDSLVADDARLTAERDGRSAVTYPESLLSRRNDPKVRDTLSAADAIFQARRNALWSQTSILEQRISQSQAEIASYRSQQSAVSDQGRLLNEELDSANALVAEGLERKSRALALQRQRSAAVGQLGQLQANIARVYESMSETRAQIAFLKRQMLSEVADQQRDTRVKIADMQEKLTASLDVSRRRAVVSPVDGTIVNLRKVTVGGVVAPGEAILDVVPNHERIVILARLKPNDIDVVYPGLGAEVRLTPYKTRVLPLLPGTVRRISADTTANEKNDMLFYEAEIVLDERTLRRMRGVRLISGMPAEVFIKLGDRSMLQYLTQPLIDSFRRAWRES